jgi:methyl-accepting chemotaxis protein-1 (serine sensor receptor)
MPAMKLRTQIIGFGVAGIVFAGVAGGIGWFAAGQLGGSIEQAIQAGQSLRLSLVADMMHDAIRADDQRAMLGAIEKQPEQIAEADKELAEHTRKFDAALVELQALPLSAKSQQALDAARTLAAGYFAAARQVVVDAQRDPRAMQRSAAMMQDSFGKLETAMEALSESIEHHSEAITAAALTSVDRIRWSILGALGVTLAAMLGFALWFANRMARPMAEAVHVADRLADGDLTVHIVPSGNDDTRALLESMSRMHASLETMVSQVKANAEQVASASAQIATGNMDLSARTERQAAALEQTAATTDQLGSTVRSNADNARSASELAVGASKVASDGGGVMTQVVDTMHGISKSSHEISGIIGVIDSIAFQTNILALNAAVEAARAGEQGRGFAVVAGEVRGLAQRSAQAAQEVRALVAASVSRVERGAELVGQAGQTMEQIVGSTRRVAEIVAAISAASLEQSDGVAQMGQAVQQIDQVTQQNAALVEQSAAAAESLSHQANQLVAAVSRFRLTDGHGPALAAA